MPAIERHSAGEAWGMASAQTTANSVGAPGAVAAGLATPHGTHTSEGTAYARGRLLPAGGTSAPSRVGQALGAPLLIARADGPRLVGADGRAELDLHPG